MRAHLRGGKALLRRCPFLSSKPLLIHLLLCSLTVTVTHPSHILSRGFGLLTVTWLPHRLQTTYLLASVIRFVYPPGPLQSLPISSLLSFPLEGQTNTQKDERSDLLRSHEYKQLPPPITDGTPRFRTGQLSTLLLSRLTLGPFF